MAFLLIARQKKIRSFGEFSPRAEPKVLGTAVPTPKVIPSTDIQYIGGFKLPSAPNGYDWRVIDYLGNGNQLSFYPPNNTLLVGIRDLSINKTKLVELSIPSDTDLSPINTPMKNLYEAFLTTGVPLDITSPAYKFTSGCYHQLGDVQYLEAQGAQTTPKLYWSVFGSYTTACIYQNGNGNLGWSDADLTNFNAQGNWRFGMRSGPNPQTASNYSGRFLFDIPEDWANAYTDGKRLVTGNTRGCSGHNSGLNLYAFAPWQNMDGINPPPDAGYICDATNTVGCSKETASGCRNEAWAPACQNDPTPVNTLNPITMLEYYPTVTAMSLPADFSKMAEHSGADNWNDGAWLSLGLKRAVIIVGTKSSREWANYKEWAYGGGMPDYPAIAGHSTGQSYPLFRFYDVDDLAAVACARMPKPIACDANGIVPNPNPYTVKPYAEMNLLPFTTMQVPSDAQHSYMPATSIGGIAYDKNKQRIYVIEQEINSLYGVAVHVFQISDSGDTLEKNPPSTPQLSLVSADKLSTKLSWTKSTNERDENGSRMTYWVYRAGRVIGITPKTNYIDAFSSFATSPVEYKIRAVSQEGLETWSNTIQVGEENGGNVPMTIRLPLHNANMFPGLHESGAIPIVIGKNIKINPTIIGGIPPYSWSVSGSGCLPGCLSLNSSTGEISGTCGVSPGSVNNCIFTVIDSSAPANIAKLKWGYGIYSGNDFDGDGVNDASDTDQFNATVTDGSNTFLQPSPTALTITAHTDTSATLSWTKAADRTDIPVVSGGIRKLGADICYKIHYGTDPGNLSNTKYIGPVSSTTISGLISGQTNYFAVSAIDFYGVESSLSNTVSRETDTPAVPNGLSVN